MNESTIFFNDFSTYKLLLHKATNEMLTL